jgi:C-terminal processing protease CtpA/Prc
MKKDLVLLNLIIALLAAPTLLKSQSLRDTVSREDKMYALSLIWKEADYNFVFFDKQPHLNWDSLYVAYIPKILATRNEYEYYRVLASFIKLLKDGHTTVGAPRYYWDEIDSPPVRLVNVKGKRYVTSVDSVLSGEIPVGSEITKLNGQTWEDYLKNPDWENNDWYGFRNTTLELTLLTKSGKDLKVVVTRNVNALFRAKKLKWAPEQPGPSQKEFEVKSLSPVVSYVSLQTFSDSSVVSEFKNALPEIRKHKALILDIRNNGGGNDNYALAIAKYLTDKPVITGSMWKARVNNSADKAWAVYGDTAYAGYLHRNVWDKHPGDRYPIPDTLQRLNMPVYILTSKRTFSAAEDFLIFLNDSKYVTRVGQLTAGSSGQPLDFKLPHGFSARICAKADEFPDGTDFINIGIKPQVYVEPNLGLDGNTRDVELETTLALINEKSSK